MRKQAQWLKLGALDEVELSNIPFSGIDSNSIRFRRNQVGKVEALVFYHDIPKAFFSCIDRFDELIEINFLNLVGMSPLRITGHHLHKMVTVPHLIGIGIHNCHVTHRFCCNLKKMAIRYLRITNCGLTYKKLRKIASIETLEHLSLDGNVHIDDSCVDIFLGFPLLRTLSITDTGITNEGVGIISRHLNSCKIES